MPTPLPRCVGAVRARHVARAAPRRDRGQVTIKLRYADFDTVTRGRTIDPTSADFEIHGVVLALYREARTRDLPVRLLGLQLAKLRRDDVRLPLFDAGERRGAAVDRVRERFGHDSMHLATTIGRRPRRG